VCVCVCVCVCVYTYTDIHAYMANVIVMCVYNKYKLRSERNIHFGGIPDGNNP